MSTLPLRSTARGGGAIRFNGGFTSSRLFSPKLLAGKLTVSDENPGPNQLKD